MGEDEYMNPKELLEQLFTSTFITDETVIKPQRNDYSYSDKLFQKDTETSDETIQKDRKVYESLMNSGFFDLQILAVAYAHFKYNSPIHPDFENIDLGMKLQEISSNRLSDKMMYGNDSYASVREEIEHLRKNFKYAWVSHMKIPAPRPPYNSWF